MSDIIVINTDKVYNPDAPYQNNAIYQHSKYGERRAVSVVAFIRPKNPQPD